MKNSCVIFDMDGTLIDSSEGITKSINYVRSLIGLSPVAKDELIACINNPDEKLSLRFYETPEYLPEHKAWFEEHYLEHCTYELSIYEGINSLLQNLLPKTNLAIATNSWDFFARKMLNYCDIGHYFDPVIGANTYGSSKPNPKMLRKLLGTLNIKPESSVLVGDSLKDAYAAKSANIPFVYVSWGYGVYDPKTPYVAHSSEELNALLVDLINR